MYRADRRTLSQEGNAEQRPVAVLPSPGSGFGKLFRLGQDIGRVNGPPLKHATTTDGLRYDPDKKADPNGDRAVVGGRPEVCVFELGDGRVFGGAVAHGALYDGVQYRL